MLIRRSLFKAVLVSSPMLWSALGAAYALEVSPGALAFRHTPGKAVRGVFTVKNDTSRDVEVTGETSPFFGFDGEAADRVKLSPSRFRLRPGAERKVSLKMRFARDLSREKALKVSFSSLDRESPWLNTVLSQAVYVVPERADVKILLDSFTVSETSPGRWDAQALVSNQGSVHLLSNASFRVQKNGKVVGRLQGRDLKVIAPGAKDVFSWSWDNSASADPSSLSAEVSIHYRPPFGEAGKVEGVTTAFARKGNP